MTWFALTLLSVSSLALAELTQQYLLNVKNPFTPRTSAILTFSFELIFVVPVILFLGLGSQLTSVITWDIFPRVLLVGLIASIAMVLYLRSFKVKNISISTIFISLSTVVSTFLGILLFSESTSPIKFLGIALILFSIVLLYLRNPVLEKNHLYGLAAGLLFGIAYTVDKSVITLHVHPLVYMFWGFLTVSIFGFLTSPKGVIQSINGKPLGAYKPILISAFGYFLYNLFTFNAYKLGGEVGKIDAINNTQVFIIILFEYFVLKHTKGTVRKLVAAFLAVIGVLILGLG